MKTIGERIDFLKKQKGLTYNDLAIAIGGITSDGIRKSILRNTVKINDIKSLCEKFDWDFNWVLTAEKKIEEESGKENCFDRLIEKKINEILDQRLEPIIKVQKELRKDFTELMLKELRNNSK